MPLSSGAILGTRGINAVPSMAPYWVFLLRHVLPVHLVAQCLLRFRRRGSLHLPAASVRQRLNLAAVIFAAKTRSRAQSPSWIPSRTLRASGWQCQLPRRWVRATSLFGSRRFLEDDPACPDCGHKVYVLFRFVPSFAGLPQELTVSSPVSQRPCCMSNSTILPSRKHFLYLLHSPFLTTSCH